MSLLHLGLGVAGLHHAQPGCAVKPLDLSGRVGAALAGTVATATRASPRELQLMLCPASCGWGPSSAGRAIGGKWYTRDTDAPETERGKAVSGRTRNRQGSCAEKGTSQPMPTEGWGQRPMKAPRDRLGGQRLLVLGFHNVDGSWCFPSQPGAGRKGLKRQLRMLRQLGQVVPLDAALRDLAEGRPLPARAVAITFDDGYRDTLTRAAPELRSLGLPATVFLIPGVLSRGVDPWWERLGWAFTRARAETLEWEDGRLSLRGAGERKRAFEEVSEWLKRRDRHQREEQIDRLVELLSPSGSYDPRELFLDWEEARELVDAGFTVGSHSMQHAILSEEFSEAQRTDLLESRRLLEDELQTPVSLLAYPNGTRGDYDPTTIAAAEAAGYTNAITTVSGWNRSSTPPYEIRRIVLRPELGLAGLGLVARELGRSRSALLPDRGQAQTYPNGGRERA